MKKKKQESAQKLPENEFLRKEREKEEKNKIKNKPIIFTTYVMVFLFLGLFSYIIYFMVVDADRVIANSGNKRQDAFEEKIVRGNIETSDGVVIAETLVDSEGNETRNYPYKDMFAHVVGYNSYGRTGLELSMNFYMLRSNINIFERVKNELREEKNPGDNVISTINYDLQKAAYDALGDNNGAVIVIEPDTGKILAMVSKPAYDPNNIDEVWEEVHSEEGSTSTVLLNRAVQGLYAPGSTFKILTLLEYMRENPDYENYSYECTSSGVFNNVSIHCASDRVHGVVDVAQSLAKSCNTSFVNMGVTLDMEKFNNLCEDFMYNSELPYEGTYSRSSFVLDENSDISEIPQTVIGQGKTQITPLHNALIISAIANGGVVMKPYLVDSIENADGAVVKKYKSKSYKSIMEPSEAEILTEYLTEVCTSGTAADYFANVSYSVAGKTGTAEYDNQGNCNSWFIGFSNVDDPDIAVSIVVEDYTSNRTSGVSVAKKIFDAYYN